MSRYPEYPHTADLNGPFGVDEPSHIHIARPSQRADASDRRRAECAVLADAGCDTTDA
jgi:hypothetical protein